MDDKENFTALYNKTGIPFQFWCLSTLREIENYQGIIEVSFTHPPSFGPQLGKLSSIDILALRIPNSRKSSHYLGTTLLFIECKKADPQIKKWFFSADFPKEERPLPTYLFKKIKKEKELERCEYFVLRNGVFPLLGYEGLEDLNGCIQSIEFNERLTTINRNQNENIYKAALQANHALNAFFCKFDYSLPIIEGLNFYPGELSKKILFIPIVVTTADLYIAEYDPQKVDPKSGKIKEEDINFIGPKSWLTYEFSLPDYLKHTGERDYITEERMIKNERVTTFIVNSEHWKEFLENFDFFSSEIKE